MLSYRVLAFCEPQAPDEVDGEMQMETRSDQVNLPVYSRVRKSVARASCTLGIHRLFEPRFTGLGSILAFHRVGQVDPRHAYWSRDTAISPDYFRRLIGLLIDRGYDIVSMTDLAQRLASAKPSERKLACLTFDDGYRDNYEAAFEVCRSFGVPMVVYVTTGFIGRTHPMWWLGLERIVAENDMIEFHCEGKVGQLRAVSVAQKRRAYQAMAGLLAAAPPELCRQICRDLGNRYGVSFRELTDQYTMTVSMLREMRDSGLVEFGAHTVSHANLRRRPAAAARAEIAESRHRLETWLGSEISHFAYPYGRVDAVGPETVAICRELGFTTAVTTSMGNLFAAHSGEMHALPRLTISGEDQTISAAEVLLSGMFPALRHGFGRFAAP
jgi:peptidoglycan/xylan/chitin deacetylase (PgdA/CDA1 family)